MNTDYEHGLSSEAVREQIEKGNININQTVKPESNLSIIRRNTLTLFNILNFVLGGIILALGAYKNALFLFVILFNLSIGITNQIRAKKAIEKLSILVKAKVRVVRDGEEAEIDQEHIVKGDIILLEAGNQVPADCRIVNGICEVNESLLTGEADNIEKGTDGILLSGSFLVSGKCRCIVEKVGKESYAASITNTSKKNNQVNSVILDSLDKLIKFLSVYIVVLGAVLILKGHFILHSALRDNILSATAAVVGMIPEGLILLTNISMALGVVRLSRKKVLVQDLHSIEVLARVDTICLDKTGTITDGKLSLEQHIHITEENNDDMLAKLLYAVSDNNPTSLALRESIRKPDSLDDIKSVNAFSSARKWSSVTLNNGVSYILGAPMVLLKADDSIIHNNVEALQEDGKRVLVFSRYNGEIVNHTIDEKLLDTISIIVMTENIRPEANEIFTYLKENGIAVKIISGDSGSTVYTVAKKAGADIKEGYCNTYDLSDRELYEALEKYSVFGRVKPDQKKKIVSYFREKGNVVSMVGDGVNDVPALSEADCAITVNTAADSAKTISHIVLLDANLYAIYNTIFEGNIVINNIQRSATLFLIKTVFSCILGMLFAFIPYLYPIVPIQLTLVNSLTIGIPSFVLAFEKTYRPISRKFFEPVLKRAVPGGILVSLYIVLITVIGNISGLDNLMISTLCTFACAIGCFSTLLDVLKPFSKEKLMFFGMMFIVFIVAAVLFEKFFSFTNIFNIWVLSFTGIMLLLVYPLKKISGKLIDRLLKTKLFERLN